MINPTSIYFPTFLVMAPPSFMAWSTIPMGKVYRNAASLSRKDGEPPGPRQPFPRRFRYKEWFAAAKEEGRHGPDRDFGVSLRCARQRRPRQVKLTGALPGPPAKAPSAESARQLELVLRIQRGEREAFSELVGLFQKKVFALAYGFFRDREDALEIVQETFMRVYEKIGAYRPDHSLQSWICRVAHNLCVDYYRKHAKKWKLEDDFASVPERQLGCADKSQADFDAQRVAAAIERAVERLSWRQREVFSLKYRQGMKLQQVAETMAISIGTVKALHHRAINRIRREVAPAAGGKNERMQ
jgi:RNA polymerase sigma-70 factor (ECF subfamily)